jgi:flavin-dependent dehydrogenase
VLDALLVEAAVEAGAELREGFAVDEILFDDGGACGIGGRTRDGARITERAAVVVGADGRHSLVAKAVRPERYDEVPKLAAVYYAYWSGLPVDGFETFVRAEDGRGWAALATNEGLTCVVVGWPQAEFATNRSDVEGTYMRAFDLAPEFAERIRAAKRETRFTGTGDLPGFFRQPYGPGWALVGDAGYHKHPITAFGITDAFRDAEGLAAALGDERALAAWHRARDEVSRPIYGFTAEFATLEPPPAEMQALFGAMQGNQEAMDDFISVMAGTLGAPDFFAPENVGRIMAAAVA